MSDQWDEKPAWFDEDFIVLSEALAHVEALGFGKKDPSTLWRWCKKGVRGRHLEACEIGGTWYTSKPAVERFILSSGKLVKKGDSHGTIKRKTTE